MNSIPADENELFAEIERRVRKLVRTKVPMQEVDDVTQYVCMQIWRTFSLFGGRSSLWTWINRITFNRISQWWRHQEVEQKHDAALVGFYKQNNRITRQPRSEWSDRGMDKSLDGLSTEKQSVLRGRLEGKTFAEIALGMGATPEGARSTYRRAVKELQRKLI